MGVRFLMSEIPLNLVVGREVGRAGRRVRQPHLLWSSGLRVWGSGFGVWGSGLRIQGFVLGVQGSGFRILGSGFRA